MRRRVVISGIGAITPIGTGKEDFWQAVRRGDCGIAPIRSFDTETYKVKLAAEIPDFQAEEYMPKKVARRMDRFCQLAYAAAKLCIDDSALDTDSLSKEERNRFGVMVGSGVGGLETIEHNSDALLTEGNRKVSPFMIPMIIVNMAPAQISMAYKLHGPCQSTVTACASSTDAIGQAFRMIKDGYADRMITGGSEGAITPLGMAGFSNMTALSNSTDPSRASIPFDKERNGFVMGEGAAILLLEEYEMAKARGATIYAEVCGYGTTGDAYHMTAPDPEAEEAARAMREAMAEGSIAAEKIGYINAHGTSTPPNDKMETLAIKKALGEKNAYKVPVSSTKAMFGHLLGAAGGIESIICALAIHDSFVPATINYQQADPDCDLDYVPNQGRKQIVQYALNNSFGFGGHNSSLLFGYCE